MFIAPDEMPRELAKLVRVTQNQTRVVNAYSALDAESIARISAIITSVSNGEFLPEFAVVDILEQGKPENHKSLIEASAFISEKMDLNPNLHYWLVSAMMDTRKFAPALNSLYSAAPEAQADILSVVEAVVMMDNADDSNINPIYLKGTPEGPVKLADDDLVDAIFNHHDYATVIANHYIARGSLDGLDELLSTPKSVSGGVL